MADDNKNDLLRLRNRLLDLQRMGALHPESFGTYQQTLVEVYNESERRKMGCQNQAAAFRRQADALTEQASAFSVMGSILYNVVNGYVELEQRRLREEQEREIEEAGDAPKVSASGEVYGDDAEKPQPATKRRRASKKKSEAPPPLEDSET